MGKYLVVVDMQKDFVNGTLGSKEAQEILPEVVKKVKSFEGTVIFTKDTHTPDYLNTQEGRKLPVEHCIENSEGWELMDELKKIQIETGAEVYCKGTFGCTKLAEDLKVINSKEKIESIEFIGVCTDICVVSNVLLMKAFIPEVEIQVDSKCCAGVTPDKHKAALETMRSCQVNVL